jgi:nucleotide-binding universal stress UspA family protein
MTRTVLVTLDGSPHSQEVLQYVPAIVRPNDEILLLRVVSFPAATRVRRPGSRYPIVVGSAIAKLEPDPPAYAEDESHALDRVRNETKDYLEEQALFLRNEGLTVKCDVVFQDEPATGIVEYAKAHGPLFIAMATHGRGGLNHAVHGSVAEQVIKSGAAPVLVVRPRAP